MLHGERRRDDEHHRQREHAPPLQAAPRLQPHGHALPHREPSPLPPGPFRKATVPADSPGAHPTAVGTVGDTDRRHTGIHSGFRNDSRLILPVSSTSYGNPLLGRTMARLPPLPAPFGMPAEQHLRAAAEFLRRGKTMPCPAVCDRPVTAVTDAAVGRRSTAGPTGRSRCA
ncbi:hypothetical protein GCM10010255_27320 [Streptomyces coeruleofuscus]|uniref:Uncharacterized protein n=1 Tax=Streptomyces coeruleofuscus TaxID=66879 RepID=A0ABN3I645_9ACTN